MPKKLIVVFALLTLCFLSGGKGVYAEDTQICTSVYGGGVVCGASTEHKPVDTALPIHPAVYGVGLIALSRVFAAVSKKIKNSSI